VNDLKIIQIGINRENVKERFSYLQLKKMNLGRYIRLENPPYDEDPPLDHIIFDKKEWYVGKTKPANTWGLTSRHYGCFLAHKQAQSIGFSDEGHFLICESDVKFPDEKLFISRLQEAINILNTTDYPLITFSEPNRDTTTTFYDKVSENFYEFDNIIGTYCYLVNGKHKKLFDKLYQEVGWHAYDWWLNFAFQTIETKMLCHKTKIVAWYKGDSDVDVTVIR